jgi:hypothetical protein
MTEIYSVGTIAVTAGSVDFVGTGTGWLPPNAKVGDQLNVAGKMMGIAEITDATHGKFAVPYPGDTGAGLPYAIFKTSSEWGTNRSLSMSTAEMIQMLATLEVPNTGLRFDALGNFAGRATYNDRPTAFGYLSLNGDGAGIAEPVVFAKQSGTNADWSPAILFRGDTGGIGPSGILVNWRHAWVTGTAYALKDGVQFGGSNYICLIAHAAGDFATDLAAGRWELTTARGAPGNDGVLSASEEIVTAASRTITAADNGKIFIANRAGGVTFNFDPVASLGTRWLGMFKNIGTGPLSVVPTVGETVDGLASLMLGTSEAAMISANGAMLRSHFRGSAGGKRELLTANLTLYVRMDGSDANNGRVNSPSGAVQSVQKAIDLAAALDSGIYDVTIQIGAGTYDMPNNWLSAKTMVGFGSITILGDEGTPANVIIKNSGAPVSGSGVFESRNIKTTYRLRGLTFTSTAGTSVYGIVSSFASYVEYQNCVFGTGLVMHVRSEDAGVIKGTGPYAITGGGYSHIGVVAGGIVRTSSVTVTLVGVPAFTTFIDANRSGIVYYNANTFAGTATGARYLVQENAVIVAGNETYLPGNAAGTRNSGGIYDSLSAQIGGTVGTVDNRLVRADGTGGKTTQGTGITVDDSDKMTGLGGLTLSSTAQFQPQVTVNAEWSAAHAGYINFQKGRSGGPVQSGDDLGTFIGQARDSTSTMVNAAYFAFAAAAAPAAGSVDANINFVTTQAAVQSTRMSVRAGLVVGAPTGGDKGQGTINATAVYDDNTLLTCMALASEFLAEGTVDTAFWDSLVPPQITPEFRRWEPYCEERTVTETVLEEAAGGYVSRVVTTTRNEQVIDLMPVWDEAGNGITAIEVPAMVEVVTPERIEPRQHELAHRFKAMVEDGFDPRDPSAYIAKLRADQALPGMPTKSEWQHGGMGSGELFGRLWLATEMLAIVVMNMHDRLTAIEEANGA